MNRGTPRGVGRSPWIEYGIPEGLPLIDADTTPPTIVPTSVSPVPGSQQNLACYRMIDPYTVAFYLRAHISNGAASSGSGKYYVLGPPVLCSGAQASILGMAPMSLNPFGAQALVCQPAFAGGTPTVIPSARAITLYPTIYAQQTGSGSSASAQPVTVASGSSSVTVTHGLGTTPSNGLRAFPASSPAASGCDMNHVWIDTVGATTFVLHAQTSAGGNLTANQQFYWGQDGSRGSPDGLWVTDKYPWSWNNVGGLLEVTGIYLASNAFAGYF